MSVSTAKNRYFAARRCYEDAKALANGFAADMQRAKAQLIDEMVNEGTRTIGGEDGTTVSLRRSFTCSVTKDNYDAIREWLMDALGDDSPFVKEVVDKPSLQEKLREMVDDDGVDITTLPQFLRVSARPDVSVRGWKGMKEGSEDE